MTKRQEQRCRKRLAQFLADLVEPMGRAERRRWAEAYVRGLLLNGERKSVEPMAAQLPDGNVQAMQQFIGQSPWEWEPVWERLAKRMTAELEAEPVWVIDDTGFPKQGRHSVGVERQYSGTLGKPGNCQVAVSVHQVGEQGSLPLGWRLYLPESWAGDPERRRKAGVPEKIVFRRKWELALEIIDLARAWGLPDRVVLADAGYGDVTEFREELQKRKLRYVVGVKPNTGVWLAPPELTPATGSGKGRPPKGVRYGSQRPGTVAGAARQARGWRKIRWREGSKGWLESRFWAARVRPSHHYQYGEPPGKEVWLLAEWPLADSEPRRHWLCDLPATISLRRLVRLATCRWKIEHGYRQMKDELGLDHYEGRGWRGWHHHVTMVMLAYAFLTLETLRSKKNFWLDPAEDAP